MVCLASANCRAKSNGHLEGVNNDFKILLLHVKDSCFGYTYDTGLGFCKANFIGIYRDSTKRLKGVNTDFIERTFTHGLSSHRLYYSKQGEDEFLKGSAAAKSAVVKVLSIGMGIPLLYKKTSATFDTTVLIASRLLRNQNPAIKTDTANPFLAAAQTRDSSPTTLIYQAKAARKTQIFNTIYTSNDSLKLFIYDNGEIDNDTVTVFHHGRIIVYRLGLRLQPYQATIAVSMTDSVQSIELMANNLGRIPPNTAYLVIWDGKRKYELRLSADYTVNARVNIIQQASR